MLSHIACFVYYVDNADYIDNKSMIFDYIVFIVSPNVIAQFFPDSYAI